MLSPKNLIYPAFLASLLTAFGCRAQVPAPAGQGLSPEMARRVEVLIRSKSSVPPNYEIQLGTPSKSEVPGYRQVPVNFVADGKSSKPILFLLSDDGRTLAQFTKYDISQDPRALVSAAGRPARGGAANAPVDIVVFDDLECPFCAKMHAQLFPALTDRYKGQVRIVYRDFPLDQHPWAMRAAIDTNCMAGQNSTGYWNLVDYIHAHAAEFGGAEKSVEVANKALDSLTLDEGKRDHLDATALAACVSKQDSAPIKQSMEAATALGVDSTPALFINGMKIEGAQPLDDVYRIIDGALVAAGQTPPAPAPSAGSAPSPVTPPSAGKAPAANEKPPAAKPGS